MKFNKGKKAKKIGLWVGYVFSYFLFTTILYFILSYAKSSVDWSYFAVIGITIVIVIIGLLIRRALK
ncbi:hypothetical protein H8D36_04890 [archaeon]|nr:hypothetical protein [archaeon]MBL7056659.1 hypothetical protein [Candidatus Woesearchaeota archaeon]